MSKRSKIIVIVGPTAVGKSAYAVRLAKKLHGEIISADSRQVYKGLNLLSGKITKKEMSGIPHHMLDIATPLKIFTVAEFQKKAEKILQDILARNKIPIIVGGTGFYIDALVSGTVLPEVPPNTALRKKLAKKSALELFMQLKKLDPRRARNIDRYNKVRLIRAIEIVRAVGKVPKVKAKLAYNPLYIGLTLPDKVLKNRINKRLIARIRTGMLGEARTLHDKGLSFKRMESLGLECRYAALYLQGKITKTALVKKLEREIWQYTKRQKTWFQRYKNIHLNPNIDYVRRIM